MEVVSRGGLPATGLVWQPRRESWVATVVCKASFVLAPTACVLAPAHEPLVDDDQYEGGDEAKSLRAPRDLVPVKPNVDVMLVGHAFAPGDKPAASLVARLSVGEVVKAIEVFGDRGVGADGAVRAPVPFSTMSLGYERAAGGPGTGNPVGVRREARGADGLLVLPNLERPGAGHSHEPIGFGPVSPGWPERRDKLGAASTFSMRDVGQSPLPEGMDLSFFNAAPRDQQLRALSPGERIVLENLHPQHAMLVTSLPALALKAVVEGRRAGPQPLVLRPDTLYIDTDRGICTLAFRGSFGLEGAAEAVRVVVSFDPPASGSYRAPAVARVKDVLDSTADMPIDFRNVVTPLPFAGLAPSGVASVVEPPAVRPPVPSSSDIQPWTRPLRMRLDAEVVLQRAPEPSPPPPFMPPALPPLAPQVVAPGKPPIQAAIVQPRIEVNELVDLLWFDPESVPRMRKRPAFRQVLDELHERAVDPDADDPDAATNPQVVEDTREVFEILTRARAEAADDVAEALRRCTRDDGRFVSTLVLVSGELETPFDEIGELEAAVAIAAPFAAQDDSLQEALASAKAFLSSPPPARPASLAAMLTKRIDETLARSTRVTIQLDGHRERVLLEGRRYQVRNVLGAKHLRTLLPLSNAPSARRGGTFPVPVYWPQALSDTLPLARRFRARIVAELRLAIDARDGHAASLRGLALARAVPPTA